MKYLTAITLLLTSSLANATDVIHPGETFSIKFNNPKTSHLITWVDGKIFSLTKDQFHDGISAVDTTSLDLLVTPDTKPGLYKFILFEAPVDSNPYNINNWSEVTNYQVKVCYQKNTTQFSPLDSECSK